MKIKYKIQVILLLFFPHIWGLIFEILQNHFILFLKIAFRWNSASGKTAENQHCGDWYLNPSKITSFLLKKSPLGENLASEEKAENPHCFIDSKALK